MRKPIAGGTATALARHQNLAGPFAVAGKSLYWAVNSALDSNGTLVAPILRLNTDACLDGMCR